MKPGRGDTQEYVAFLNFFSGYDLVALHRPRDASCNIKFTLLIHISHLRCFASDKTHPRIFARLGHAGYDFLDNRRVGFLERKVIEEGKRRSALAEDIIAGMIHDVLAEIEI